MNVGHAVIILRVHAVVVVVVNVAETADFGRQERKKRNVHNFLFAVPFVRVDPQTR